MKRSILPSKDELVTEWKYGIERWDWYKEQKDLTPDEKVLMYWYADQVQKISKCLNVLYPGWEIEVVSEIMRDREEAEAKRLLRQALDTYTGPELPLAPRKEQS